MLEVVDDEIDKLRELVDKFKGVGVYQDYVVRWSHYIEAFEILKRKLSDD
jgi:hypothetical protein